MIMTSITHPDSACKLTTVGKRRRMQTEKKTASVQQKNRVKSKTSHLALCQQN